MLLSWTLKQVMCFPIILHLQLAYLPIRSCLSSILSCLHDDHDDNDDNDDDDGNDGLLRTVCLTVVIRFLRRGVAGTFADNGIPRMFYCFCNIFDLQFLCNYR